MSPQKDTIKISGMSCSHCKKMVAENLSHLEGVKNVSVNLDENAAAVNYDSTQVGVDVFKKTIEKTGYGFEGME